MKDLIKLMEEYRKIKGYDQGGQVEDQSNSGLTKPEDVKSYQDLSILDKAKMALQGIDPYTGKPKKYADGGEVSDPSSNLTPEQFAQHLQDLKDQGYKVAGVEGEPVDVNYNLTKPLSLHDATNLDNPDDRQLAQDYANEDFKATESGIKADEEADKNAKSEDEQNNKDDEKLNKDIVPEEKSDNQKEIEKETDLDKQDETDKILPEEQDKQKSEEPQPASVEPGQSKVDDQSSFAQLLSSLKPQGQQLAEAQRQRDMNIAGQQIMKGAALFGAGSRHANPDRSLKVIGEQDKYVGLPVEKYKEQLENQQYDPNSPMTKALEQYLTSKGIKTIPGASAADYLKYMPFLAKDAALVNGLQKVVMQTNARAKEGEANRESRADIAAQANQTRINAANILAQARKEGFSKTDERTNKRLALQASKSIETDPTVKKANDRINSTDSALTQLKDMSMPLTINRLNAIQIDLANTLNFMSSQGASDYKAKSDKLENLQTRIAAVRQKYGNQLIDLRKVAPNVYNDIVQYAQSVHKGVSGIKDKQIDRLSKNYGDALGGDVGQRIKDIYKTQTPQMNQQDQQALQHYQSLAPNDPNKPVLEKILRSKGLL